MGVSQVKVVTLAMGGAEVVCEGPAMLTALIISELSGTSPVTIDVTGADYGTTYMKIVVPAGQTVLWQGEPLAFGAGIGLGDENGDAAVTVAWR